MSIYRRNTRQSKLWHCLFFSKIFFNNLWILTGSYSMIVTQLLFNGFLFSWFFLFFDDSFCFFDGSSCLSWFIKVLTLSYYSSHMPSYKWCTNHLLSCLVTWHNTKTFENLFKYKLLHSFIHYRYKWIHKLHYNTTHLLSAGSYPSQHLYNYRFSHQTSRISNKICTEQRNKLNCSLKPLDFFARMQPPPYVCSEKTHNCSNSLINCKMYVHDKEFITSSKSITYLNFHLK